MTVLIASLLIILCTGLCVRVATIFIKWGRVRQVGGSIHLLAAVSSQFADLDAQGSARPGDVPVLQGHHT